MRMLPWSATLAVVAVSACTAKPPEANAVLLSEGPFATGDLVGVDGSKSADVNKKPLPLSFSWRVVSAPPGSESSVIGDDRPIAAVIPDVYGDYVIGLIVSNSDASSPEQTVPFTVAECGNEAPVVASATATPSAPNTGDVVSLAADVSDLDTSETCGLEQSLTYQWSIATLPSGSAAVLNDANAETPSFLADRPGDYTLRLVVTDSTGIESAPVDVPITVSVCGDAAPSVDDVILPGTSSVDVRVPLNVTVSDADNGGDCGLTQALVVGSTFLSKPAGSSASFAPAEGTTPAFVPDVPGDYVIRTTVADGTGRTGTRDTTVSVDACGDAIPTLSAVAYAPELPNTGDRVQFSLQGDDLDALTPCSLGQELTYSARFVSLPVGSGASLTPAVGASPSFVADQAGTYGVRLTVTDSTGRASSQTVSVVVSECGANAPTVTGSVFDPASQVVGGLIELDVVAADADVDCGLTPTLTVVSEIVDAPVDSSAQLAPAEGTSPSFVADQPGDYVVRTTVTDESGRSDSTDTVITVGVCGDHAPDALLSFLVPSAAGPGNAVDGDTVTVDSPVQLSGIPSTDADLVDPCNLTGSLDFTWSFLSIPAGSRASFNDVHLLTPSFTPDVPGEYLGRMTVTDGRYTDVAVFQITAVPVDIFGVANGFSVTFVAGGGSLWNRPKGVTVGPNGNIYVVQSGSSAVTVTPATGVSTSYFAFGGELVTRRSVEDIVYAPSVDAFYVSVNSRVVRVDNAGNQTAPISVSVPRAVSVFTPQGTSTPRLQVTSESNAQVEFFSLSNGSSQGNSGVFQNSDALYGHESAVVGQGNTYWVTDRNRGEVRRSTGSVTETNQLDTPRDIVRAPSGALYVADDAAGVVYKVTDCGQAGCSLLPVAFGNWNPYGLWLENANTLLVTDNQGEALYRLTNTNGL